MTTDLFAPYVKQEDATYVDIAPVSARHATSESYAALVWRKLAPLRHRHDRPRSGVAVVAVVDLRRFRGTC